MCPTDVRQRAYQQRKGNFWAEGLVHMTNDGYWFLASALLVRFADVKLCRKVEDKPAATAAKRRRNLIWRRGESLGSGKTTLLFTGDTT
jgi:hypothetical protein